MDLALNNLQRLIAIKPNKQKHTHAHIHTERPYLSLPPTKQDLTQGLFYRWSLEREGIRLEPCWSMLVFGSLNAIRAKWANCWILIRYITWVRHVCLLIALTRSASLVLCNACQWRHRPSADGSTVQPRICLKRRTDTSPMSRDRQQAPNFLDKIQLLSCYQTVDLSYSRLTNSQLPNIKLVYKCLTLKLVTKMR